jgi:hypothetical protein
MAHGLGWRLCVLVSFAMMFLSLLPQIQLWAVRGKNWHGAYVSPTADEVIYSAYLNALIAGRPRKNDPFAGEDTAPNSTLPESTFSIQFIPPYTISFFARLLHMSASTTMIVLIAVAALLSSLSIFWLIAVTTRDFRLAAVATLFVLCLGGAIGGTGLVGTLLKIDLASPVLPFLRRYQPAAAFPLFFVFMTFVWHALTTVAIRTAQICAGLAGVILGILVFSYLYLWTSAGAWVLCCGAIWFIVRPTDRGRTFTVLTTVGVIFCLALIPYLYLITHRTRTLDAEQALVSSHYPDLFRIPEIVGVLILVGLFIGIRRGTINKCEPRTIFAASLAILPLLVFNQQVITGRVIQPHHFAHFVANYCVLVALPLSIIRDSRVLSSRVLVWVGVLCFLWGLIEVGLTARFATVPAAIANDKIVSVLLRLKDLSKEDGTVDGLRTTGIAKVLVFSPRMAVTALLPTWTSQGTLLDMRGLDFGTATDQQRKQFLYMHLYYCNIDPQAFGQALNDSGKHEDINFYSRSVVFGYDRVLRGLAPKFIPIRAEEINSEVQLYQAYINSFSHDEVLKRPIRYAIIPVDGDFDFSNLDRWYERDAGERVGDYVLYALKLK